MHLLKIDLHFRRFVPEQEQDVLLLSLYLELDKRSASTATLQQLHV